MSNRFDTVVIGSGISGLTCGAFLARSGMKVLVAEQHHAIGGYAHSFRRRNYRFESGVHSVSLSPEGLIFHLLRLLGVDEQIEAVSHEAMYSFTAGSRSYRIPSRFEEIIDQLSADFPHQQSNLKSLFADMRVFYETFIGPLFHLETRYTEKDKAFIARYYNRSYTEHLGTHLTDPRLIQLFSSQWPFWGMPPDLSPTIYPVLTFYIHALEGSHYIKGGFQQLAKALAGAITDRGGEIRVWSEVTGLSVERQTVRSAHLQSGEEIEADLFISNIAPHRLHESLIPENDRNKRWRRRLRNLNPSVSAIGIYCGLHRPVSFPGGSTLDFWFADDDYNGCFRAGESGSVEDPASLVFLHSPMEDESTTMLILYFVNGRISADWKSEKMRYAEAIIKKSADLIPGFREALDYYEVASPDTFARFTGNTDGALYGFENTKEVYGEARLPSATYLKNLFQTGHWCKPGGGVWNVMECGYTTARQILSGDATPG